MYSHKGFRSGPMGRRGCGVRFPRVSPGAIFIFSLRENQCELFSLLPPGDIVVLYFTPSRVGNAGGEQGRNKRGPGGPRYSRPGGRRYSFILRGLATPVETHAKTALHLYFESVYPAFQIAAEVSAIVVLFRHGPSTLFSRRSSLRRRRNAYSRPEPRAHAANGLEQLGRLRADHQRG